MIERIMKQKWVQNVGNLALWAWVVTLKTPPSFYCKILATHMIIWEFFGLDNIFLHLLAPTIR